MRTSAVAQTTAGGNPTQEAGRRVVRCCDCGFYPVCFPAGHGDPLVQRVASDFGDLGHGEATQAGRGGSDRHGHVESEERFEALGLSANDADGFGAPEPLDEPALLGGERLELVGGTDRQSGHRRFFWDGGGVIAKTSKKSFSSM